MKISLVDLKRQYESIKGEINTVISEVIDASAFIGGRHVQAFEEAFATFCNVKHCVGVGNGSDALLIALKALGIGAGDEVITVANTFIATAEMITMTGAQVVFVDIDPKTYNLAVDQIEDKITPRTKAIIPVHLYGQPADIDPVLEIAKKYDLRVIEDAAQAHGADYKGRRIGSLGDVACFSFYPGKNLGAYGDAGAIVTNDDDLANWARVFANHGRCDKYNHDIEGINSRLDGIQAAILGVKLKYLPEWSDRRRQHASLYDTYLQDSGVITPSEMDNVRAVYHLYVIRVPADSRQAFQGYLQTKGIATGIHYPIALPNLQAYAYLNHREDDFPEATKASREIVSLPMFPELTREQLQYITGVIKEFCG